MKCELLSIGSELLAGETVDTNTAFLGDELARLGAPPRHARQLPDDRALIGAAFVEARGRSALVIATGGLGPTHDDLTREALADALGEKLAQDATLAEDLRQHFRRFGTMPEINLKQAAIVPSAEPLANPIGSAPGWWVDRDRSVVVLLPGVPSEMRRMWSEQVMPRLVGRFSLPPLHVRVVKTFGIGESAVAERLGELLTGEDPSAGIYARDDGVHLRFWSRTSASAVDEAAASASLLLGDDVYGTDATDLPGLVLQALGARGVATIATWESETQGALLALFAAVAPGDGAARFVGGLLDAGLSAAVPDADVVLQLSLDAPGATGRSRLQVSMAGRITMERRELRVHGSGPQRLRRAAFAALDQVRRHLG